MVNDVNIEIKKSDGSIETVNLITYLIAADGTKQYIVYSKNETQGTEKDHVIYISKLVNENNNLILDDIDDEEWKEVQHLLKKIANAE